MNTETRKQREIAEREAQILSVARRMLAEDGYIKLNMDRIAKEIEYAKGTVYQHFKNKEDIIVALDIAAHDEMHTLFRRAASLRGNSRQKMAAVGVASNLMIRVYPDHLQISRITCNPAILDKVPEARHEALRAAEGGCMRVLAEIVREAVENHELQLPANSTPEDLVFGLWAMSQGTYEIVAAGIPLIEKGVQDPIETLWLNFAALLDGYQWRPLSHEEDFRDVRRRAWIELFQDDYAKFAPGWVDRSVATSVS
jgi:AcrR family transcriptional regulator